MYPFHQVSWCRRVGLFHLWLPLPWLHPCVCWPGYIFGLLAEPVLWWALWPKLNKEEMCIEQVLTEWKWSNWPISLTEQKGILSCYIDLWKNVRFFLFILTPNCKMMGGLTITNILDLIVAALTQRQHFTIHEKIQSITVDGQKQ